MAIQAELFLATLRKRRVAAVAGCLELGVLGDQVAWTDKFLYEAFAARGRDASDHDNREKR